jgi:beta-glucanase (GH16 family)
MLLRLLKLNKLIILFLLVFSCSSDGGDDPIDNGGNGGNENNKIIPSDLNYTVQIQGSNSNATGDGTGKVNFTASAINAVKYSFRFGDGGTKESSSGSVEHTYTKIGTHQYNTRVLAYSSTNDYISSDKSISVLVSPESDQELVKLLAGDSEKTWKINAAFDAHFANGSSDHRYPSYFEAEAFSKNNAGFYDDEYTFNVNGTYTHKTNGDVFGKASHLKNDFGDTGQSQNADGEIEKYAKANYSDSYFVYKSDNENKLEFLSQSFIGFYVGEKKFTIECHDGNNLLLRTVDNNSTAWYVWLTTENISTVPSKNKYKPENGGKLIWSDEFNYSGELDTNKWNFEVRNQWYNNELQATTNLQENAKVEDGVLKIIALKKSQGGKEYTSARVRTHKINNLQGLDFMYGRVDVRAKMPSKKGTWPAIWMLGSNYSTNGNGLDWPHCGEMDILEHTGNHLNTAQMTAHHPDVSPGVGDTKKVYDYNDLSTNFHVYSLVWTPQALSFYIDDKLHHVVGNACSLPYNWNFNIILNIAMGGDMGGEVDPNFDSDTMEVDYVRVYQ